MTIEGLPQRGDRYHNRLVTRMGFVLESDDCIGCHACTVACKSEHDVPLGVNRTWVKYVETGQFPNTSRAFTVMRCNQCDDAPCMKICPTNALFRADNGIVDFDDDNCIGCKSCMNACPYDAIYINPETNTAHKCNYCNHRVTNGLAPACAVVCPTEAIVVGDLDDPNSKISKIIARDAVTVRSPEQGTNPKVYYRGAEQAALDPTRSSIANDGMIWADTTHNHASITSTMFNSHPESVIGRTTYTTAHKPTWQSKVSGYLVTKAIAAGVMLIAGLLALMGYGESANTTIGIVAPMVAGVFLAITGALLIGDLKQPGRFYYLLTRSNTESWLVRGAWILAAFAALCALWWIGGLTDNQGLIKAIAVPTALFAAGTAGYTAFLFGQCEGRDLWQTPLLLPTLLAQAVTAGGAAFALLDIFLDVADNQLIMGIFCGGLLALGLLLLAELWSKGTRHVELAMAEMTKGAYASRFWGGGIAVGLLLPLVLVAAVLGFDLSANTEVTLGAIAGVAALAGMFAYEDAYVKAGQSVPLS